MGTLALSGGPQAAPDHRDRIIASLEQENRDLQEKLREAQAEVATVRNAMSGGVAELRKILSPLHQALRLVFGEIDRIAPADTEPSSNSQPQNNKKLAVWESWKQKLPGKRADFIQALLDHGEMTAAQLKVATHSGLSTVPQVIHELNKLGLIQKNGNKYSLKEL